MLRAALVFLMTASGALAQETGDLAALRTLALDLVNQARSEQRLAPLAAGGVLDDAALAHARDMLARDFYAHVGPDGRGPRNRYLAAGGGEWKLVAENIARCEGCGAPPDADSVRSFQHGWMESPEHRANILAEGVNEFGFAIVAGEDVMFAVQEFAGPEASSGGAPIADAGAATQAALDRINAARTQAEVPPLQPDPVLMQAAEALVPEDASGGQPDESGDLLGALPEGSRGNWRRLAAAVAVCGGCGAAPVMGDVEDFVSGWLAEDSPQRPRLLDPGVTHAAMALRADGEGRKTGLLVLGTGS